MRSELPEKLDLRSHDIAEDKRQELLRLYPEIRTEGGKIDIDRLKLALGESVDTGKERYGMNWPGKTDCFKTIQMPSLATLRPCPEESVNFDTTENLIIEGDNLEVLKLLQKSYLGKVKMIYIDPPYNTGNDFIYPDNYSESLQTYLEYTGQVDAEGRKFGTNTDTDGRFHSKWLNMMYPRLYLARNLLRQDGMIFMSVDDNEINNLKKLCDEIFGEENFIGLFVVNSSPSAIDYGHIAKMHDYAMFYAKAIDETDTNQLPEEDKEFKYEDKTGPFNIYPLYNGNIAFNPKTRPNLYYPFYLNPSRKIGEDFYEIGLEPRENWVQVFPVVSKKDSIQRVWRWGRDLARKHINQEIVGYKTEDGEFRVVQKTRHTGKVIRSLQIDKDISTRRGTAEVEVLFGTKLFLFPKPVELIRRFIAVGAQEDSIVLDFFAGSGTTAHAVLELNKQDGGNRKFILVQLPEPTGRSDYPSIPDITKERVRRVIQKLNDQDSQKTQQQALALTPSPGLPLEKEGSEGSGSSNIKNMFDEEQNPLKMEGSSSIVPSLSEGEGQDGGAGMEQANNSDRGFKVFKLAESNFKPWEAERPNDAESLTRQLDLHIDHIREGRTADDLLYELLLKSGFPLSLKFSVFSFQRGQLELKTESLKTEHSPVVYSVADGALFICLEQELTLELIRAMAEKKPERVVCLDEGFAGNDQLKANAVQIFKTKGITSFKTV